MNRINLAVGLPAYKSTLASGHAKMWIQLGSAIAAQIQVQLRTFIEMDMCGIERARNFLLAHAMSGGAEWLLMVDSDTWVSRGAELISMIREADRIGAAIVGAAVMRRRANGAIVPNVFKRKSEADAEGYEVYDDLWRASQVRTARLIPVAAIGAAVMAIDMRKIGDAEFRCTGKLSEDLDFCEQITNRGGSVYVDPTIETHHVKRDVMSWSLQ